MVKANKNEGANALKKVKRLCKEFGFTTGMLIALSKFWDNVRCSFLLKKENRANGDVLFQRIYHNHIRKCAGTSMNLAMIQAMGGDSSTHKELVQRKFHKINLQLGSCVGWNTAAINRGSFFYAFSHEPLHRLKLNDSTFTFCFLRDPVERVISHYNMLKDLINDDPTHVALIHEKKFAFGDFDHFLNNIPREHLEAQLFNFSSSYNVDEAIDNLRSHINFVCDVKEPNEELLLFISSEFGLNINYRYLRASKTKFKPSSHQYARLESMVSEEAKFMKKAKKYFGLNLKVREP